MKPEHMSSFLDMFNSEVLMDRDGQQMVKWVRGDYTIRKMWQYQVWVPNPPISLYAELLRVAW